MSDDGRSGDFVAPKISIPHISVPRIPDSVANPAKWAHERIIQSIINFEAALDNDKEIGARLVTFSQDEVMHIEDVGYWGPDFVIYYGTTSDGKPMELIQHTTQTNILLISVDKIGEKPNRIGFDLSKKLDEQDGKE